MVLTHCQVDCLLFFDDFVGCADHSYPSGACLLGSLSGDPLLELAEAGDFTIPELLRIRPAETTFFSREDSWAMGYPLVN